MNSWHDLLGIRELELKFAIRNISVFIRFNLVPFFDITIYHFHILTRLINVVLAIPTLRLITYLEPSLFDESTPRQYISYFIYEPGIRIGTWGVVFLLKTVGNFEKRSNNCIPSEEITRMFFGMVLRTIRSFSTLRK